ncbi:MAG: SLC13 family permease, partial [Chitinophagaceae bacterium]|nr:SLC13 family permease [Chitinophagaceae bacterium]
MATLILLVFLAGYTAIALEHRIGINKSATALVTGALCWGIFMVTQPDKEAVTLALSGHLGSISEILFFLLGAMTIVELIDAHEGFQSIIDRINARSYTSLLVIISFVTFFLSAILDNMTTTIVMVSLLRKLIPDHQKRLLFAGMVVIAANAGGAWSPIGDVTTTMLWIGNQITALNI